MIIFKNSKSVETRQGYPFSNFGDYENVFIVDDNSELGQKILQHAPFFEFVLVNGELVDITPIERPIEPTPEPQPTEIELLQEQVNLQQALLDDLVFNIIPNMVGDEL